MRISLSTKVKSLLGRSLVVPSCDSLPFQAVLWDMDGTLFDTEKLWSIALVDFAAQLNVVIHHKDRLEILGATADETITFLHNKAGYPDSEENHRASKEFMVSRMKELFTDCIPWRPGAESMLMMLHAANIPMGLVTNTERTLTDFILERLEKDTFQVTICGDEVARGKPSGDPYRYASRALGLEPEQCLVLEDSLVGLQSGSEAGCPVIAIPCEAEVPSSQKWVTIPSLSGIGLDELSELCRHIQQNQD